MRGERREERLAGDGETFSGAPSAGGHTPHSPLHSHIGGSPLVTQHARLYQAVQLHFNIFYFTYREILDITYIHITLIHFTCYEDYIDLLKYTFGLLDENKY